MIKIKKFNKAKNKHIKQLLPQVADIETRVQGGRAWSRQTMTELLATEHNHLLMASSETDESKPIVAFCLYQVMFENAEILRMGTHLKWQRRGIADSLIKSLFSELRDKGVESLLLEVRADNKPAIKLYTKNGFKHIDTRAGYYQQKKKPAVDALIMKKML